MYSVFSVIWNPIVEYVTYREAVNAAKCRWKNCQIEQNVMISKIRSGVDNEVVGYLYDTAATETDKKENA